MIRVHHRAWNASGVLLFNSSVPRVAPDSAVDEDEFGQSPSALVRMAPSTVI
jgi:hypothetical protein